MFKGLEEEIKALNKDANKVTNSKKAKALRKKLLSIGITMAVIGYLGVFVCFILFVTGGLGATPEVGITVEILVPFFLMIPCSIIGSIGTTLAKYGFKIVVAGYTTKLIDDEVGNNCPQCGDIIEVEELFCSKCGYRLKKKCSECGTINSHEDKFCKKCGKEL